MLSLISRISAAVNRRIQQLNVRSVLKNTPGRALDNRYLDTLELLCQAREMDPLIRVIYDVGGHIGKWTILAKSIFPEAAVHVFEPLKAHQTEIEKNVTGLKNVFLHRYGLGTAEKEELINIGTASDSSSLLQPTENLKKLYGQTKVGEQTISVVSLDYVIQHGDALVPDLIKLDVQGYELEVFKGAIQNLNRIKFILIEVSFVELYKDQPLFGEVISFLFRNKFEVVGFGKNIAQHSRLLQADVLLKNTQLVP